MKISFNTLNGKIWLHALVWTFLLLFPLLIFIYDERDTQRNLKILQINWLQLAQYAVIFYLNYSWLLKAYFFKKKFVQFVVINLLVLAAMLWLNDLFHALVFGDPPGVMPERLKGIKPQRPDKQGPPPFRFFWLKSFFSLIIPTFIAITLSTVENWFRSEEEKKEAGRIQLESELQNLRYQLQPHFFFNSLNNIYSLVEVSPPQAQEAIHGLSKMMRYLLYETSRSTVGLDEEIRFITSYISLMKLRQTDKTRLEYHFPGEEAAHWGVAPLLFIPLIENAFKHGVSATKASEISFEMTLTGQQLLFVSINTNYAKADSDKSGSGIGLINLRKRLELLYQENYSLTTKAENDSFVVRMLVQLSALQKVTPGDKSDG